MSRIFSKILQKEPQKEIGY